MVAVMMMTTTPLRHTRLVAQSATTKVRLPLLGSGLGSSLYTQIQFHSTGSHGNCEEATDMRSPSPNDQK
jgi:hypothetical protein